MSRRHWTQHLAGATRAPAAPARVTSERQSARPRPTAPRVPRLSLADLEHLDSQVPPVQRLDIQLMGKPRMSQRDKWLKRPCVLRYRAQADHLRLAGLRLPMRFVAVVFLRMPDSWSRAERRRQVSQPHLVKPDFDNLAKGLLDSLAPSDAHLWDGRVVKRWAWHGRLLLLRAPIDEATLDRLILEHAPREPDHVR